MTRHAAPPSFPRTRESRRLAPRLLLALAPLLAVALAAPTPSLAQLPASAPALGAPPSVKTPAVQRARLANGLELLVVTMREVPVVEMALSVPAGSRADGDLAGLATFTARMMTEGADTLDAFGISAAAEYLGASIGASADWDQLTLVLRAPKRTLAPAMDLLASVALRPTFRASDVARQRGLRLAAIAQQRDLPDQVATRVFAATVYPEGHPYHRPSGGDSASTVRLDSATVRGFWQRAMQPRGARLYVAGDISLAEAKALAEARFGAWRATGTPFALAGGADPARPATTVYLVDKPGAAQSVFRIGHHGVARTSPDFVPLTVMNTLLGGSFSSRLNDRLREVKGYSYGAQSLFQWSPLTGAWLAATSVRTNVTDSALVDLLREVALLRDSLATPTEITRARNYVALGLAGDFETPAQVLGEVSDLVRFGLPLTYYDTLVPTVLAVTAEDVRRVARTYLQPDRFVIVVVGDLKVIRPGIEKLGLGPVRVLDADGRQLAAAP